MYMTAIDSAWRVLRYCHKKPRFNILCFGLQVDMIVPNITFLKELPSNTSGYVIVYVHSNMMDSLQSFPKLL